MWETWMLVLSLTWKEGQLYPYAMQCRKQACYNTSNIENCGSSRIWPGQWHHIAYFFFLRIFPFSKNTNLQFDKNALKIKVKYLWIIDTN